MERETNGFQRDPYELVVKS